MRQTLLDILKRGKAQLSERFIKHLHFINFFQLDAFLQHNLERVNDTIDISSILYGGMT